VIDNRLFRLSLAIPEDWYANIRPEGGEFAILDPVAAVEAALGFRLPGGAVLLVSSQQFTPTVGGGHPTLIERQLSSPNTFVAGLPATIWEDTPPEGLARSLRLVFERQGIVFQVRINVALGAEPAVQTKVDLALQIVATITSY
jgi:hypothetical protein